MVFEAKRAVIGKHIKVFHIFKTIIPRIRNRYVNYIIRSTLHPTRISDTILPKFAVFSPA
jgi:hypothetical protein